MLRQYRLVLEWSEHLPVFAFVPIRSTHWAKGEKDREYLQRDFSCAKFQTWIKKTAMIDYQDGYALIATPTAYAADWLIQRPGIAVVNALSNFIGHQVNVDFEVVPEMTGATSDG